MIAKNKYIILKYIYSEIILIQKTVRGYLTRNKFKKFLDCLKKIIKIQRIYHKRHIIKVKSITKIQEFYIRKLTQKKLREKIIAKKKAEAKGEYYNLDLEPYEDFTHNNYNLENALRIIRLQNNKEKLTSQLINEKDPKKILDILLYGTTGKKNLTRAQKLRVSLKIEDKLINQGEIMKERKKFLTQKYDNQYREKYKFQPSINKGKPRFGKVQTKKNEFIQLFKDKNIKKEKEIYKNTKYEKIYDGKNYDLYMKNIFDRLHNEKLRIEQRKKIREEYLSKDSDSNRYKVKAKKSSKKLSLKELLLSDEIKKLYKKNSLKDINKQEEIWPTNLKKSYSEKIINDEENEKEKEKEIKSFPPVKKSDIFVIEENKNEFYD